MERIFVPSEIGTLRKVIVHSPDDGISRISPRRAGELLFDDIVYLPQMQHEHRVFVQVLWQFVGRENVLEVEDIIREALDHSPEGKKEILDMIMQFEELPSDYRQDLDRIGHRELAKVLISGYLPETDTILFDPIPNFIFTRDIAVVINDHVIISKAAKEARYRENLLTRFSFWHHPLFEAMKEPGKIINLNIANQFPPSRKGEVVSIEGGDMMILNPQFFLVGCSERSTMHAFHSLKNVLFEKGVVENVVTIKIPQDRAFMHIDTVFTQIHENHIVAFEPIVMGGLSGYVEVYTREGSVRKYSTIQNFILSEVNPKMEFISAGGGESPYQEREQWTDACNLLAVKPGVTLAYDRNVQTAKALVERGYQILSASDFLASCTNNPTFAHDLQNTIITLPSAELSRARGGSHCMSCPIIREG
ncbi:MAG TPA: arginine deiminase family protein [Saprospiraceae bacterium]|nr:arginine deiminase family protein [Saprospiraceae bacterium]